MAKGAQDYFNIVDIGNQTVSELVNRPKYGEAATASAVVTVTASGTTTLLTVTGKGMIYGGTIRVGAEGNQRNGRPKLVIDNVTASLAIDFSDRNTWGWLRVGPGDFILTTYDIVNDWYAVVIPYGLTFETNVILQYVEALGDTPNVNGDLVYALI